MQYLLPRSVLLGHVTFRERGPGLHYCLGVPVLLPRDVPKCLDMPRCTANLSLTSPAGHIPEGISFPSAINGVCLPLSSIPLQPTGLPAPWKHFHQRRVVRQAVQTMDSEQSLFHDEGRGRDSADRSEACDTRTQGLTHIPGLLPSSVSGPDSVLTNRRANYHGTHSL